MQAVVFLLVVGTTIWVGVDAGSYRQRYGQGPSGTSPTLWVLGCVLLWIVFFPLYLVRRTKDPRVVPPPGGALPTASSRFCVHCGTPLAEGAAFCGSCGQRAT